MITLPETKTKIKPKVLIPVIAAAVAVIVLIAVIAGVSGGSAEKQLTTVTTKLEKILEISNLQTAQTIYNAVATKKDDAGENVRYYAAYEGTIKAGIDFSKIVIDHDSDTNTITVTLPPAEILESTVNPGTVEYIFIDKKAETETVAQEAYRLCKEDLQQRAEADKDKLLDVAAENAGNAVEGLIRPWLDPQVQLIIK